MCEISGFISDHLKTAGHIRSMNNLIRHLSPDDEGFALYKDSFSAPVVAGGTDKPEQCWRSEVSNAPKIRIEQVNDLPVLVALGHRRLSIIDVSPYGHQPMSYLNGRYWITYNGEIYNYIELRAELESLGHRFISQSDIVIILAAFAQWGADCFHHFNGMWVFAIYDTIRKKFSCHAIDLG